MDAIDIRILKILQSNAGLSINEIADRINLSHSSCWRRIRQLQERGIIRRNVALLDREKLGFEFVVFVMVSLVSQTGTALEEFESSIRGFLEVLECYTMTGQADYMLKIVTRDMRHYEDFVRNNLAQLPNVREFHSHVAVTKIKDTLELPLDNQP